MDLRIYNSSEKDDVIHDCEIALIKGKDILESQKMIDPSTIVHGTIIPTADNITAFNIGAKRAVNIPINISFKKIDEILKSEEILLSYKDRYFKQKQRIIQKVDFTKIPTSR